jgi:dTDP-4-dehydrorhamnose reductase
MKMLITGSNGMLGRVAIEYFSKEYYVFGIDLNGDNKCDITDEKELSKVFKKFKPDIVLHCAAIIDVDYCEKHLDPAFSVNVNGTGCLIKYCKKYNSKLIYISTSMVFDGKQKKSYIESNIPFPINIYSVSKKYGELVSLSKNDSIIIRTNIIGLNGYFYWVYNKILNKEEMGGYSNINFNAIYVNDFVKYIDMLIKAKKRGIYHITSRDWVSKYQFAKMLEKEMRVKGNVHKTEYLNKEVKRPLNAVLDCSKFEKEFKLKLPTIKETLKKVLGDMVC